VKRKSVRREKGEKKRKKKEREKEKRARNEKLFTVSKKKKWRGI